MNPSALAQRLRDTCKPPCPTLAKLRANVSAQIAGTGTNPAIAAARSLKEKGAEAPSSVRECDARD